MGHTNQITLKKKKKTEVMNVMFVCLSGEVGLIFECAELGGDDGFL